MTIRKIKCRKCNHDEDFYIEEQKQLALGKFSMQNSFLCNACDSLSLIDSVSERLQCKTCRSNSITKVFPITKIKCPKCGNKTFDQTTGIEF